MGEAVVGKQAQLLGNIHEKQTSCQKRLPPASSYLKTITETRLGKQWAIARIRRTTLIVLPLVLLKLHKHSK
jgi:hypothetical protein